jgi:hypothetical protein
MDSVLKELDVGQDKLAALKRDYLLFASYDLFQTFDAIVDLDVRSKGLRSSPINLLEELPRSDFRKLCHGRIPKGHLPEEERAILGRGAQAAG